MKKIILLVNVVILGMFLFGCKDKIIYPQIEVDLNAFLHEDVFNADLLTPKAYEYEQELNMIDDNYRNYYEIFVGSFNDSNGDKMGDLKGITQKLDYLQNLGVTGLWLMPIHPSSTYHKYNVEDYYDIDKDYGTLEDFDELIKEAKKRNIVVIIDLVINHTSSNHPWFIKMQEALRKNEVGNRYYNYYNVKQSQTSGYHAFPGGSLNGYYYEGYFDSGMPDLNMDSEYVREEVKDIIDFWLDRGVQGFRIDAAMHVYPSNNKKNIEFFEWFMDYARSVKEDVYVVSEVWSSSTTILEYYKSTMNSVFNYTFGDSKGTIAQAIAQNQYSATQFYIRYQNFYNSMKQNNENAIDALFLSNHDNARSAGVYRKNIFAIKFAAQVYLMLPGNPFIYYGEEIGMLGSSDDPSKRQAMYWSNDPSKLTTSPPSVEVTPNFFPSLEIQINEPNLIYSTYQRALRIRNENPEIARGTYLQIGNEYDDLGTYSLTYNNSTIYILQNFSKKPLTVNINELGFTYEEIRGFMSATSEDFVIKGDNLYLPAYSTLVLK